jgi:hypothetical protein
MRRILLIAVLALFGTAISGLFQSTTQVFPRVNSSRRVEVNAKTVTPLAPGQNYVVDLTQRGVKYEFNHQAGKIDLRRVRVRTVGGEVAIDSFLKTLISTDMLATFRYTSQSFSLGILPPDNPRTVDEHNFSAGYRWNFVPPIKMFADVREKLTARLCLIACAATGRVPKKTDSPNVLVSWTESN